MQMRGSRRESNACHPALDQAQPESSRRLPDDPACPSAGRRSPSRVLSGVRPVRPGAGTRSRPAPYPVPASPSGGAVHHQAGSTGRSLWQAAGWLPDAQNRFRHSHDLTTCGFSRNGRRSGSRSGVWARPDRHAQACRCHGITTRSAAGHHEFISGLCASWRGRRPAGA